MATFKQKPKKQKKKKKNIHANSTLDKKHKEKTKKFENKDWVVVIDFVKKLHLWDELTSLP